MAFRERLKQTRKSKGFSQSELSKMIDIHVTNISRYERGENQPASGVLSKLADALGVTADYLMSGSIEEKAQVSISDKELLSQFKMMEQLPSEKKMIVKELIAAFLLKSSIQHQLVH